MINIINSESSFNDIDSWIKDLRSFSSPDVKVFLIGNKADLEESRVVSKEQALQVQKDFDLDLFMETSAKTGFNAKNLFMKAGTILYEEHLKIKANVSRPGSVLPVTYIPEITESTTEEDNRPKKKCVC